MKVVHECPSCGARWQRTSETHEADGSWLELLCPSGHRTVVDAPRAQSVPGIKGPRRARRWMFVGGPADGHEELRPLAVAAPDNDVWRRGAAYRLERAGANAYVFGHLRAA